MPVTSMSPPPRGRSMVISSELSGSTTHSLPRARTRLPTVKVMQDSRTQREISSRHHPNSLRGRIGSLGNLRLPWRSFESYLDSVVQENREVARLRRPRPGGHHIESLDASC